MNLVVARFILNDVPDRRPTDIRRYHRPVRHPVENRSPPARRRAAFKHVVALTADQAIQTVAAQQAVVTRSTIEPIVAITSIQSVVAGVAEEIVAVAKPSQDVVAWSPGQAVAPFVASPRG